MVSTFGNHSSNVHNPFGGSECGGDIGSIQ